MNVRQGIGRTYLGEEFPLESTTTQRVTLQTPVHTGADATIQVMDAAMQRAWATSEPMLMLIRTDRSSAQLGVLQELQAKAVESGAWSLNADANVLALDGPYGAFLRALAAFAPQIAAEPSSVGAAIRHRLQHSVGENGKLITDFCPAFAPIIPATSEPEALSFGFARERLETLFVRIFTPWSPAEPPYVFFLRHASRSDAATLRSLSRILAHAETRRMIVVAFVDVHDEPRDEAAWRAFLQPKKYVVERFDYGMTNPSARDVLPPSGIVTQPAPEVRQVLEAAAIQGQMTEPDAVAAALGISTEDAARRLGVAVDAGILRRHGSFYAFVEPRMAWVCHEQTDRDERALMHRRVAAFGAKLQNPSALFVAAAHVRAALRNGAFQHDGAAERTWAVEILLQAARHSMALAAHDVAMEYLTPIVAMAPDGDVWSSEFAHLAAQIDFTRLECACATGDRLRATMLRETLQTHVPNAPEMAAAQRWLVEMATRAGEHVKAVELARQVLAPRGIHLEPSSTPQVVDKAFADVWDALGDRAIEEIADLERMTDPGALEATEMLFTVHPSAQALGAPTADLVASHMARLALQYGNADASSVGHATLGAAIIARRKDHRTGMRLGKLALQLCEQRCSSRHQTAVAMKFAAEMSVWTNPLQNSIDQYLRTYEVALRCGDARSATRLAGMIAYFTLLQGTALDDVAEGALHHRRAIRTHGFDDEGMGELCEVIERFVGQQKGRTVQRRTRSGAWAEDKRLGQVASRIVDLMAQVLTHEYESALFISNHLSKSIPLVGSQILVAEYWFWTMIAATSSRSSGLPERFEEVLADFEHWADRCPQTFQHKHALLSAERARLEGRDMDAMRAYDQAIAEARDNGFTHIEALAADIATRFYLTRDFPLIAEAYFRTARLAYGHWGASAKTQQMDRRYPKLLTTTERTASSPPPSIRSPGEMDVFTAVKVAQAVAKEIVLQRLLVAIMKIVIEHIAAERCHVLLEGDDNELNHAGKAVMTSKGLEIEVPGPAAHTHTEYLPLSIVEHVRTTRESVCLDDAFLDRTWSDDRYVSTNRPRSVACFPILRQSTIVGILYLENNSGRAMFTPKRLALLEFLANQAAISLEHAKLYADLARENTDRHRAEQILRRSEERLRRLVETADVIPWEMDADAGHFTFVGAQAEKRLGWPANTWTKPSFLVDYVHADDQGATIAAFAHACAEGKHPGLDFRVLARDGQAVWLHMVVGSVEQDTGQRLLSGFFFDITERKESEQTLRDKLAIIERQKNDIRALSTPLLDVSEGIVAMPVLGELDEDRASRIMDVLLETISRRNVRAAILDLTGVSAISNATAEQIGRIVRAVELLGARAIVAGIRADVARAIVTLDVGLGQIETRASMKDALRVLFQPGTTSRSAQKNHLRPSR